MIPRLLASLAIIGLLTTQVLATIIFEDDFEYTWTPSGGSGSVYPCTKETSGTCTGFSDYPISAASLGSRTNANSWNGYKATAGVYDVEIGTGYGVGGGGGVRFTYASGTNAVSGESTLYKWLGAEYDEVYIRWKFKYDDTTNVWQWGDGVNYNSFQFNKVARFYQGVDLESMRETCDGSAEWKVHPSNYPGNVIPQLKNAGEYGSTTSPKRVALPILMYNMNSNQYTGGTGGTGDLWRWEVKYDTPTPINIGAAYSPDSASTDYVCGPIYSYAESAGSAGEFKLTQTWHTIEFHLKSRQLTADVSPITATHIGDWSFSVSGDQTSTFTAGKLVRCNGTGGYSGCMDPALHSVASSSFGGGITTVTLNTHSYNSGNPFLTASLTTVEPMTEISAGQIEVWIDGVEAGNYHSYNGTTAYQETLLNSNVDGGWSFVVLNDNMAMARDRSISLLVDDFVVSTTPVGVDYTIGGSSSSSATIGAGQTATLGAGTAATVQ